VKKVEDSLCVLDGVPRVYVLAGGGLSALLLQYIYKNLSVAAIFRFTRKLPGVSGLVQGELDKSLDQLKKDVVKQMKGKQYVVELPQDGWSEEKVMQEIQEMLDMAEFKSETGALSGTCHKPEESIVRVVTNAYAATAYTNPLNPDAYPGIRKMEAEVVRMTGELFHGGEDLIGTMTSGGTESLILAVLAYRGFAREMKGITKPNLVMPSTGHVGFDKAGHLLGVEVRHVPVDPHTCQPTIQAVRNAIDRNTVMLVGSAPQYPHGIIDPIQEIGELGLELDIPVHVDACLGGFLIVFADRLGLELEPFDFRVPGVTSISADTHKFGYAPKGSSVIMYRDKKHIHHQYYISADWSGGIFVSPTLAGSRSGGIIAATWAALVHHGQAGYVKATSAILDVSNKIREGVQEIPGLQLLGEPKLCIIAFTSSDFHIYQVADQMKEAGWLISCIQNPTAVHLYVVPSHTKPGVAEKFLTDLRAAVLTVSKSPNKLTGRAAVYGMAQQIPDRSLVNDLAANFLDILYSTKTV